VSTILNYRQTIVEETIMKKEIRIGLVLFASFIILQRFSALPDFVLGIIMGICLACFILGLLPTKISETIKSKKNKLFRVITKS
jgi:MFS superfamily sulfate permease-like transporter